MKERENRITIRVSEEEFKILQVVSKYDDRTVSNFVRFSALKVASEKFRMFKVARNEDKKIEV